MNLMTRPSSAKWGHTRFERLCSNDVTPNLSKNLTMVIQSTGVDGSV